MDPNPYVAGGGAKRLEENGIEVIRGVCQKECDALIRSFTKFVKTKTPYVTIKTAYQANGSMIPPSGKKTFTQESSLRIAHELRKRADAIWVASGTVLHDLPKLNVRNVPDFPSKKRYLILSDRRNRIPQQWIQEREEAGFQIFKPNSLREGLDFLTKNSCLEVLVEPGPTFLEAWRKESLWDEIVVVQRQSQGQQDKVKIQYND